MSVSLHVVDGIAVATLDHPPVNSFNQALRQELFTVLLRVRDDPQSRALVLQGAGRGFSAGGDMKEVGTPASIAKPGLSADIHPAIEYCGKPVIAALHGMAVGGGLETALACHYRVAHADTKIGLPEVRIGTIPLSGTQRLPRVLAIEQAIAMILDGSLHRADEFRGSKLFDEIIDTGVDAPETATLNAAIALAHKVLERGAPHALIRELPILSSDVQHQLHVARERWPATSLSPAQRSAWQAIVAALEACDFDAGLAQARISFESLIARS
jgi:enoyl-CoA hydratase/carnithine racemase